MKRETELLYAFEVHDAKAIRKLLAKGVDPNAPIKGKPPIVQLYEMYARSSAFADCLSAMFEAGARLEDEVLKAVLLDDASALRGILERTPGERDRIINIDCTFTALKGVTPLHVCAEYNSLACARTLLEAGADIDARAIVQPDGTGGHTPLFHTVNSIHAYCRPMMELLVEAGASLDVRADSLMWGGGFDWETVIFEVTPISYAQCGLLPQFHRKPGAVYEAIARLYRRKHGREPTITNVPNKYLQS